MDEDPPAPLEVEPQPFECKVCTGFKRTTYWKLKAEELQRQLIEKEVELELYRGKFSIVDAELAAKTRRFERLEHQMANGGAPAKPSSEQIEQLGSARKPKPPPRERANSPLTELQTQRRALKPSRRAPVVKDTPADKTSKRALIEKNRCSSPTHPPTHQPTSSAPRPHARTVHARAYGPAEPARAQGACDGSVTR
jgi:hypothetical protein